MSALAQEKDKSIQLKVFSGFDRFEFKGDFGTSQLQLDEDSHQILSSATIAFVRGNHFYEVEIDEFSIEKMKSKTTQSGLTTNGSTVRTTEFRIRFSYNYLEDISTKSNIAIGLAVTPYILNERISPLVLSSFARRNSNTGASLDIMPRFQYYMTGKVFFETHLVMSVIRANKTEREIENPALPARQRIETDSTVDYFSGDYQVSFGIGVTL